METRGWLPAGFLFSVVPRGPMTCIKEVSRASVRTTGMKRRRLFLTLGVICASGPAAADIGVLTIAITLLWMVVWLLPVIGLEAWLYKRRLGLQLRRAAIASSPANAISTFVGVPTTWFVLIVVQMLTEEGGIPYDFGAPPGKFLAVTWQAPWLRPFESGLGWMIPVALAVLFVPFFFVSWWIEAKVVLRHLRPEDYGLAVQGGDGAGTGVPDKAPELVRRAARDANALPYALMLVGFGLQQAIASTL